MQKILSKFSALSEISDFRALSGIRGIPEAFVQEELQDEEI